MRYKIRHGLKIMFWPKFLRFSLFFVQGKFWNQMFRVLYNLKMFRNVTQQDRQQSLIKFAITVVCENSKYNIE